MLYNLASDSEAPVQRWGLRGIGVRGGWGFGWCLVDANDLEPSIVVVFTHTSSQKRQRKVMSSRSVAHSILLLGFQRRELLLAR